MRFFASLVFLAAAAACTGKCEDKTVQSGACSLKIKECECIKDLSNSSNSLTKFEATVTELNSGVSSGKVTDKHKNDAYEKAIFELFNDHLIHTTPTSADYCNCQHADEAVGKCTIRATVCAMFNSTADVATSALSYQAWATDMKTSNVGHVTNIYNPAEAGKVSLEKQIALDL